MKYSIGTEQAFYNLIYEPYLFTGVGNYVEFDEKLIDITSDFDLSFTVGEEWAEAVNRQGTIFSQNILGAREEREFQFWCRMKWGRTSIQVLVLLLAGR